MLLAGLTAFALRWAFEIFLNVSCSPISYARRTLANVSLLLFLVPLTVRLLVPLPRASLALPLLLFLVLLQIRGHAVELARDHALDELGKSHADLTGGNELQAARARSRNTRLIFRLRPGRFATVHSAMGQSGEQGATPAEIAGA